MAGTEEFHECGCDAQSRRLSRVPATSTVAPVVRSFKIKRNECGRGAVAGARGHRGCAQPAGRASRDLQAEDRHVRCGHARAVCGERCGWGSAAGRHFAFGIGRTFVVLTVSRS